MKKIWMIFISVCLFMSFSNAQQKPLRVVSMNLCTDQLAVMLADEGQLISLSHISLDETISLIAQDARRIGVNYGLAEEIIRLKPDLVLAGTYTTRTTVNMLKRFGINLVEFTPESTFQDIETNLIKMGKALGQEEKAAQMLAQFQNDLKEALQDQPPYKITIGSYGSNQYTTGDQTLENQIVEAAGYKHLGAELGIMGADKLTLESLILSDADMLMTWERWRSKMPRSFDVLKHPALKKWYGDKAHINADSRYWICGTPHIITAIKDLKNQVHAHQESFQ